MLGLWIDMLISLSGIDGAGKTTHAKLLRKWLQQLNFLVSIVRLSKRKIARRVLIELKAKKVMIPTDLYGIANALDYAYTIISTVIPALKKGEIIICDRYIYDAIASSIAFQDNSQWPSIISLNIGPQPDIAFLLDVPVEIALDRIRHRQGQPLDHERYHILRSAREAYLGMSEKHTLFLVDASKPIQDVQKEIRTRVIESIRKDINKRSLKKYFNKECGTKSENEE